MDTRETKKESSGICVFCGAKLPKGEGGDVACCTECFEDMNPDIGYGDGEEWLRK